jgi:hypothetical protein
MNTAKFPKIISALLTAALFIWLYQSCGDTEPMKLEEMSGEAKIISQNFVAEELKAPSTADFPGECDNIFLLPDSTFMVKACADAQNSFGAKIRTYYECKIKYKGGDWADKRNWELLKLDFLPN